MGELVRNTRRKPAIGSRAISVHGAALALGACVGVAPFTVAHGAEPPASAETGSSNAGLEEVLVTARRRTESLEQVPMSVAVIDSDVLASRGVFSATSFNETAPGLRVNTQVGDRNWLVLNIRGQGQTYGSRAPSVVPYLAEVPLSALSTESFFDLQNVQVLKGPQGTLFGKVTDGGAILLTPNRPGDEFGGEIQVKSGNYGLVGVDAVINTPIVEDKVLFRGAMQINQRDGYTIDRVNGKDYDNIDYSAFRAGLTLNITDTLENYTLVQYQRADENGTGSIMSYYNPALPFPAVLGWDVIVAENLAAGPRSATLWSGMASERETWFVANTTTWEISDTLTLKNILGYVDRQDYSSSDYDGSAQPLVEFHQIYMPNFWVRQYSEELQLQGSSFGDKLEWITGIYADHSSPGGRAGNERILFFGSDVAEVDEDNKSIAGFAQGSYDLSEALKLTIGGRYTYERNKSSTFESKTTGTQPPQPTYECLVADAPPNCLVQESTSQDAWTYNVGLDYQMSDETLLYVVTRKGYKGGGYQIYFPRTDLNHYDAETIKDVELGMKRGFTLGSLVGRVNLAGFYAESKDIQRLAILVDTSVTPPTPYSFVANAAAATVKGIDFETSLLPFESLRLDVRYTYTDYAYEKTEDGLNSCVGVNSASGRPAFCPLNKAPGTPEHSVSASVSYTLPFDARFGEISIGAEYSYQSDVALGEESYTSGLTGNDYNAVEPAYALINASLNWKDLMGRPLDLSIFGTNLEDKLYRSGSNNLSSNVGFAAYYYGEPRMYGASLKYRFGASH